MLNVKTAKKLLAAGKLVNKMFTNKHKRLVRSDAIFNARTKKRLIEIFDAYMLEVLAEGKSRCKFEAMEKKDADFLAAEFKRRGFKVTVRSKSNQWQDMTVEL